MTDTGFHNPGKMRFRRHANWLIALAFASFSANAFAEWSRLGSGGDAIVYVDTTTLERTGNAAAVWSLKDYPQMQTGLSREKFRSAKIYYEFKCSKKLMRQSYLTRHYGPMGGAGSFPSDSRFHPWTAVSPGTEKAMLFEFACQ